MPSALRARPAAAAAALFVLGCAPIGRPAAHAVAPPLPDAPHVTLLTYNVNYGLAGDPETIAAIRRSAADIVLLQETTAAWEQALRAAFAERYPHMAFRHCCGAGGLGVMARFPFEERAYVPSEAGWFPAWHLIARTPLGPLQLLDVHLRPPVDDSGPISGYFSTPPIRRAEIAQHVALLDPAVPAVIAGDFNEGRSGGAVELLAERGFRSALSDFAAPPATWRWQTSLGTLTMELDHIAYGAGLRVVDCRTVPLGRSDHLPLYAELVRASDAPPGPASDEASDADGATMRSDAP